MAEYYPEGMLINDPENTRALCERGLEAAMEDGRILECAAFRCDKEHGLHLRLGEHEGIIPRSEVSEDERAISALSRVGKAVCFKVMGRDGDVWLLSRRAAMNEAMDHLLETLSPGQVIGCRVTHIEPFGVFVDIGCGNVSFIGVENISVSRISTPAERFTPRRWIRAAVLGKDLEKRRVSLTHKELLGTWEQNAARFCEGETVGGVIRGIEDYGVFVELAPNLSGLAERVPGIKTGMPVAVYIRAIIPGKMKIKLNIIDHLDAPIDMKISDSDYFITGGVIDRWRYSPQGCPKTVETIFRSVDF